MTNAQWERRNTGKADNFTAKLMYILRSGSLNVFPNQWNFEKCMNHCHITSCLLLFTYKFWNTLGNNYIWLTQIHFLRKNNYIVSFFVLILEFLFERTTFMLTSFRESSIITLQPKGHTSVNIVNCAKSQVAEAKKKIEVN